jgi:crotonobetaine/carnitine-CoA ligase
VTGQIAVRPKVPGVTMLGYWQQPEATVEMWRNLWLHSGDAGHKDEEGNFYFTDRLRDTIRRRGENISSMEVEGIIAQHPDVLECAVYPVRSEHGEDEVMVASSSSRPAWAQPQQIIAFLEPRMPRFMVPRFIDIVEGAAEDLRPARSGSICSGMPASPLRASIARVRLSSPRWWRRRPP